MFVVCVTFRIKAGLMDDFLPLMLENAKASLDTEKDCHRFDVCRDTENPDTVFLYEIYENRAAFETHLGMEHFALFSRDTEEMVSVKEVRTCDLVSG